MFKINSNSLGESAGKKTGCDNLGDIKHHVMSWELQVQCWEAYRCFAIEKKMRHNLHNPGAGKMALYVRK